ncbi:MAG TPA: hypothetical protein VM778_08680, partial [Gemmatimonadota bacterium]|nr:hypothetical protein [Gemmatimonadota bacterium]
DSGEFFFLEMNTRLQVEHPVTEMVTGLDLVRLQLAVAAGAPLPVAQEDVVFRGHAIECRIAAEDATAGFLPATGRVAAFRAPAGPGVRWDGGIEAGTVVSPHYDPLLAKCVAWGETRDAALERMARALEETEIAGVETNLAFQRALLDHPDVRAGAVHTTWLEGAAEEVLAGIAARREADAAVAAALAAWCRHTARAPVAANGARGAGSGGPSRWREGATWIGLP